jgi:chromosome segregation ATPase
MQRLRHTGVWLSLIAGALALAVALVVLSRRTAMMSAQVERAAKLDSENKDLRARTEQLAREVEALRIQLAGGQPPAALPPAGGAGRADYPTGALEAVRMLGQARDNLAAANRAFEQLRTQTAELEGSVERLKAENQRLAAEERELSDNLAGQRRLVEALQSEMKGKSDRLAPLELSNRGLRKDNEEISAKVAAVTKLTAELEEINRQRDSYLSNILRRYRDVTDQYRALAARLENPEARAGLGGTDLSRIQSTVSLAEEDLRQLQGLNAQAQSLQKKIRGN